MKLGPRTVAPALIGLGAGLRIWQWSAGRSLWVDEAAVAVGLLVRPLGGLLGAHDLGQISPPGWLALVRGSAAAFGPGELALRLPTLVLSILYLPMLWLLLRRFVTPGGALVGLAVAALAPALVDQASMLKPYGADPFVAVLVLLLVLSVLTPEPIRPGRGAAVGLGLAALSWFSTGGIIVAVGALTSFLFRRRPIRDRVGEVVLAATAGAGFGAVYLLHYRPEPWLARYLAAFWHSKFLSLGPPDLAHRWWRTIREVLGPTFVGHGGDLFPILLLLGMAFGANRIARRMGPAPLTLLLGPVAGLIALAALGAYPISNRLTLFLAPCLTVLLAAGWDAIAEWMTRPGRAERLTLAGLGLVLAILLVPPADAVVTQYQNQLTDRSHARPIVRELLARRRPSDPIYVYSRAIPEWWFYTTDWRDPDRSRIERVGMEGRGPDGQTHGTIPSDAALEIRTPGGVELYGRYPALRNSPPAAKPESGWAAGEAGRLMTTDAACLWLVELHAAPPERAGLRHALAVRGYGPVERLRSGTSSIVRVCRSPGTS